jgi:polysaccharide deacetylase family protein (PEP-CTERM system associated)
MSPEDFREDVRRTKATIEDLIGERILGYRAPSYSITLDTLWALELLAEEGYVYDSSIFPIYHDRYGIPDGPRYPFYIEFGDADILSQLKVPKYLDQINRCDSVREKKSISDTKNPTSYILHPSVESFFIEFPITTLRLFGLNLPIVGGGYFRFFPLWFTLWAVRRLYLNGSAPLIFYMHPWEIDPDQPNISGLSFRSRFRHYINLSKTKNRLKKLLPEVNFTSFREVINHQLLHRGSIINA